MDWKTLYLDPKGRIGQKDFWIGLAIVVGVAIVAGLFLGLLFRGIPAVGTVLNLALLVPYYCLATKRLHDFGKPDTLAIVVVAVNAILLILSFVMMPDMASLQTDDPEAMMADPAFGRTMGLGGLSLLVNLATLGFVLWIGLTRGDDAPNAYGPPRATPLIGR